MSGNKNKCNPPLITSIVFVLAIVATLVGIKISYVRAQGYPERISLASDGSQANDISDGLVSISSDGRYVAFSSNASNLVSNDTNYTRDIFIRDRQAGTTERVSIASDGTEENRESLTPSITADGRYIAFASYANNLVANDTNGTWDIFVHDRQTGTTERVSVASDSSQGNNGSQFPSITADGRYIAFWSYASNLVSNDSNGLLDIFVHDRQTGKTERINVEASFVNGMPSISSDGRYVAFASDTTNLVPNDTNSGWDVFVHDRQTGTTERVSVASDGSQGNNYSYYTSISSDGRYVAFASQASNLVSVNTLAIWNIFVHDRQSGTTEVVSTASNGAPANDRSYYPSISTDGRYVAFVSLASNLVSFDTNNAYDVFVHDREANTTQRASVAADNSQSDSNSGFPHPAYPSGPTISADGGYVAFDSDASNLISNDTNGKSDIFVTINPNIPSPTATPNPTLIPTNHPPILDPIGNKTINEGQLLRFTITASDPDNDTLTYSAVNLPPGATFDSSTHTFSWTPGFDQQGNYENVEFTVSDNGTPMELDTELITITVGNVNRPPVFDPIGSKEVLENELLTFTVNATDPDGNGITRSATNLPIGASFDSQTGVFSWTPTLSQAGNYIVTFNATDNGTPNQTGTIDVAITVGDNPTPTEQARNLVSTVITYNFPTNIENSYLANLKKVEKFIEEGKIQPAINQLNAFIAKVEGDYTAGIITQAIRDNLVGLTQALLADLR